MSMCADDASICQSCEEPSAHLDDSDLCPNCAMSWSLAANAGLVTLHTRSDGSVDRQGLRETVVEYQRHHATDRGSRAR